MINKHTLKTGLKPGKYKSKNIKFFNKKFTDKTASNRQ